MNDDDDNDSNILLFPKLPPRPKVKERIAQPAVTHLPPKVQEWHGSYYYRDGGKRHLLSRVDQGAAAMYTALQKWTGDRPATYGQLMILYVARALPDLKPATQPEYLRQINGRLQRAFGHMRLNTIEQTHIAQYLQLRKAEGAAKGGNRERATLSSIISWGMRFGWCSTNPCYGVRRNKETPSKVYVSNEYLKAVIDGAPPCMQNLFAVAYLTGLRQTDLRLLTRENITEIGIKLDQSKDGKRRTITWSPVLKYFVERALAPPEMPPDDVKQSVIAYINGQTFEAVPHDPPTMGTKYMARGRAIREAAARFNVSRNTIYYWLSSPDREAIAAAKAAERRANEDHVFLGPSGRPFTKHSIQSAMKRLKAQNGGELFRFRELRPKAATDADHNLLGHDAAMLRVYLRGQTMKPVR